MAFRNVRFVVSDGDQKRLDSLVEYFGNGSRSTYLRVTLKVMESLRRVERLHELQAANRRRLAERGIAAAELPGLIQEALRP